MSITAMKQALEALELCNGAETAEGVVIYTDKETTALRQAIEQAEKQEPVLWQWKDSEMVTPFDKTNVEGWTPLYTTPQPQREWVGLTVDECVAIGVSTGIEQTAIYMIETKLKEKNT